MDQNRTLSRKMAALPNYAYTWQPYANEEMIYKQVQLPRGTVVFTIDPWTQRWILTEEPVPTLLKLADGHRRLSEIVRILTADLNLTAPPNGFAGMAQELREVGMLFTSKAAHRVSGLPVYNKCEPIGFHLEITNACNMSCTHCYVSSGRRLPGELTLEEIYKTIDMLPPFSGKRIAISGGEPAIRRDCEDIIEYCTVKCGHDVDLYTNGKRFPQRLAERILDINRQGKAQVRIQVSLEGARPETNDLIRGKGSFDAAMKSLEMFKRMGLNRSVVLFVCATKYNIHEVDDLIKLAESLDVSMLVFSQWQKQGNASDTPWSSVAPSLEEWIAVGEKLLKYNHPHLKVTGNFWGDLNNDPYGRFCPDGSLFPKQLYFYNVFPRITPDGHIFADQLWVNPDWILGNVRQNTLDKAFESPKFYDQLNQMRKRWLNIAVCKACEWRSLCEGGSPGHTYAEYGHMNERDWFCEARIYWFNRFVEHQVEKAFGG
jgi:radical SAM protein with 4Fe4S-binding SPASM domain